VTKSYICGFCKAEDPSLDLTIKALRASRCWLVLCNECRAIIAIVPEHVLSKKI